MAHPAITPALVGTAHAHAQAQSTSAQRTALTPNADETSSPRSGTVASVPSAAEKSGQRTETLVTALTAPTAAEMAETTETNTETATAAGHPATANDLQGAEAGRGGVASGVVSGEGEVETSTPGTSATPKQLIHDDADKGISRETATATDTKQERYSQTQRHRESMRGYHSSAFVTALAAPVPPAEGKKKEEEKGEQRKCTRAMKRFWVWMWEE